MIFAPGLARSHAVHNPPGRHDDPIHELRHRQAGGPAVEYLHGVGTRLELSDQVPRHAITEDFEQRGKTRRIAISPKLRRR